MKPLWMPLWAALCQLCLPEWALARTDFSAWKDSTRVFIDASPGGANVAARLTNFPLLLRLNASVLDFSALAAGGRDLRFATKDGILLSHEIESFNAASNEAVVWIKVPVIDSLSASQYFVMYWNNPAAADISNGAAVFDTADGYAGVWHLNDAGAPGDTGAVKAFHDATRNKNHGDDFVSGAQDTGAIGFGRAFDGIDDHVQIPSAPSLELRGPLSLSIWCRAVSLKPGVEGDTLNALIRKGDDNPNSYQLAVIGGYLTIALDADDNSGIRSKEKLVPGRYYHVAASYEGKAVKLYINGAFDSEFAVATAAGSLTRDDTPLQLGGRVRNGSSASHDQWHGSLDEAWVSRLPHKPAYFKLSYETQKAGSNVLSFSAFPSVIPIPPLTSWFHSRKILLNTSATGAGVAGDVADFPLLVRLNADLFDFSQAKADGSDLRFSDAAGLPLAHAVERWDAAGKTAEIWVSLPRIEGNSAAGHIIMYWGLADAPDVRNPAAVFDTASGFAGVWHLQDGAAGNSGLSVYRDQTANRCDGMDFAVPSPASAVVGKGQTFADPDDRVEVRSCPSLALNSALTLSAWIKGTIWDAGTGNNNLILRKGGIAPIAYDLSVKDGHLKLFLDEYDTLGTTGLSVMETGQWYQVAATWGDGLVRLYVNGKPDLTAPAPRPGPISQDTLPLYVASRNLSPAGTGDWFNGALDEIQISRLARSADWIKLAYENQKTNSRFTIHEGYESRVPPAETTLVDTSNIAPRAAWTYDTILAPGTALAEKGSFRLANDGAGSVHVVITPAGDTVAQGVSGSEALIRILGADATAPAAVFTLDSSIAAGRHVFKVIPGSGTAGRLIDLGDAAAGSALTGPGSWIFAWDTAAPVVRVLDQGVSPDDSSWILLGLDDNTAEVAVACASLGVRDGSVPRRTALTGGSLRYAFLPAAGTAPVRVRFTVSDGSRQTAFPAATAPDYVLSRSLPDFHAPVFLKGGLAWSLVGVPIRAAHALSLRDLAGTSGADRLFAAAWKPGAQDATAGEYEIGGEGDSLPTGGGLWLAAGKETSTLPLGRVFSIAPGADQGFAIRLNRGWNQIAAPALENLPWIVSKKDIAAYDLSPVKGLHEYVGNGKYADVDTLEPWKGYFVLSAIDTTVRLTAQGSGAPKSAASKTPAAQPPALRGLQVLFEPVAFADGSVPAPIGLRLGAAAYARDGLAREDEAMPTAPGQGAYLAASRDGRNLRTDVIGLHPESLHAWKIAWTGTGARRGGPARLKLSGLDLPEGLSLWAAAPSWSARRLSIGGIVEVPDLDGDTLAIWAASAGAWSPGDPVPGLSPVPAALAAGLKWGPQGGLLTVDLPRSSGVIASVYAVDGRCAARLKRDRLAPGRHMLPMPDVGRVQGLLFLVLEFPGAQGTHRMILRTLAAAP